MNYEANYNKAVCVTAGTKKTIYIGMSGKHEIPTLVSGYFYGAMSWTGRYPMTVICIEP